MGGVHHIGIAVANIQQSISMYTSIGWQQESPIIEDLDRNIWIVFMKSATGDERIELVAPINEKSPVTKTLERMKKIASPYHLCYEVQDLENAIEFLKAEGFMQTTPAAPAVAFSGQRVVFLLNKDVGLIELVEST